MATASTRSQENTQQNTNLPAQTPAFAADETLKNRLAEQPGEEEPAAIGKGYARTATRFQSIVASDMILMNTSAKKRAPTPQ
jgi:hypothetical protein